MADYKGWIIYSSTTPRDNNAFGWFVEAAKKYSIDLELKFEDELNIPCSEVPDFALLRTYNSPLSSYLESQKVRVFNSTVSMELSRDKYASYLALKAAGVASPKSRRLSARNRDFQSLIEDFGQKPFILKQTQGSKGENVYLIQSEKDFTDAISECGDNEIMVQEYINTSYGKDIRVWVVGGEVCASVLRKNDNSFKSNYAQGGSAYEIELPQEVKEMAIAATAAVGLDFAGVDILFLDKGFSVCEINGNAGFRTLALTNQHPHIDLPSSMMEYISKVLERTSDPKVEA